MHHIFASVQAMTAKLKPSLNKLSGCHTPAHRPSSHPYQKWTHYKVRVVFSEPVHATTARTGPHGPNHGPFTAKPSSHNVHVNPVGDTTSPCPTLYANAEPTRREYLSVRCDETENAL